MRFFDSDTKGPKIPPLFVVGFAVATIVVLVAAHLFL
ncbi:MAG: preprotein translocase subunit Sec61beta [Candidatus Diapherotrites archaeon]|nr:preprotein translocase subunit Sec61beta [Candidatus Diapherotrites archaeon]